MQPDTHASGDSHTAPPPLSRADDVRETLHGVEIPDPYRWLEDQNGPETRAWVEEQNNYTRAVLDPLPGRDLITRRLEELMKVDTIGLPVERGGRYFYSRRKADQELFVIVLREGLGGEEQVLIDPHPMSPDHTTSVQLWDVSADGKRLVYGIRRGGEDETTIHLLDVDSRQDLPDSLPRARYFDVSLQPDGSGFYYSRHGEEGPRVLHHSLGAHPADDREIFGQGYGPEKIISSSLSEDGRTLLLTVEYGAGARKTELYFQDAAAGGPVLPLVNDLDARFEGQAIGDWIFIQTDWQAPNGRILRADLRSPARDQWNEIVPTGEEVIESFSLVAGRLFVNTLHDVHSRIRAVTPDGGGAGEIKLPGIGSASSLSGRWDHDEAFFGFTSFHFPWTIYRYSAGTGSQEVWARVDVPVDSSQLEVRQAWYPSKDGTKIPMFLVHRRGLEMDGNRPTLMTGYGGFNASLTPAFSARAAWWAEQGGVFALPNLRGGGEFGEDWHRAGMLESKQNTFDDFIAAAEWLIANQYTSSSRLAIAGGSNGGLLVGAALTQRPELFRAVVCSYPLLDMVRYHRFLVASFWVPEYGSSDDPEQFRYLHAYSPYHQVRPGVRYPAVLFITGDADTRVDPLHARKMAALLQSATGSGPDRPVLLHYDTQAGHSGGRPLSKQIQDLADELQFLWWQVGGS